MSTVGGSSEKFGWKTILSNFSSVRHLHTSARVFFEMTLSGKGSVSVYGTPLLASFGSG
jgi:hypothetical protein